MDRPSQETLTERLLDGKTYREIALEFGVSVGTVFNWLNAEDMIEHSARARELSAEAWLDRGLGYLESALSKESGLDAGAARALAQECARRAAIRNPKYRESQKVDLEHSGGVTFTKIERVIKDPANRDAPGVPAAT